MTGQVDIRYLAIDQGGHASRASLCDGNGRIVATANIPIETRNLAPDRVEHDPEAMVASLRNAIAEVVHEAGNHPVVAAGLATQRASIVCWDKTTGAALSPILSWQDRRAAEWLHRLDKDAGQIRLRTGLPLSPHYGASKLRWCLDHLPAVLRACREGRLAWGPLASFLVFRLTAERTLCADPANASRTLLWNIDSSDWDPRLIKLFGIPGEALPPCVPTRHAFGRIRSAKRGIPLTLVTGDQSAALFADNSTATGNVSINLGTGAFLQQPLSRRPATSRLLISMAYQDLAQRIFALEGTVNGAGSALSWAAQQLNLTMADIRRDLPDWLRHSDEPPLFLNGIAGLGTPYLLPMFASRFVGEDSPAEKCVAVIESIVFLLQVNLEEMTLNATPDVQIILSGGLSRLDGLCQRLADLSGIPLRRPPDHEASVRGLIRLLTANQTAADPAAGTRFLPKPNSKLAARYRRWRNELETSLAHRDL